MPNLHRQSILDDTLLSQMIGLTDRIQNFQPLKDNGNYPPHDLIKLDENNYVISVVVAGYKDEDLEITAHNDILFVKGKLPKTEDLTYVHQGIAKRQFKLQWTLDKFVEVAEAALTDGILHIKLQRKVPESELPKTITIK